MKIDYIEGTIMLKDGTESKFILSGDGWQQWGAGTTRLAKTTAIMDRMQETFSEEIHYE